MRNAASKERIAMTWNRLLHTLPALLLVLALAALTACGGDDDTTVGGVDTAQPDTAQPDTAQPDTAQPDTGADTTPDPDTATPDTAGDTEPADTVPPPCEPEPVFAPPAQAGVAYVGHFLSGALRMVRLDGAAPVDLGAFDMGAEVHEMVLDPLHDVLYVAHDVARIVNVFRLDRPDGPADDVGPPTIIGEITFTGESPRFLALDPLRQRLYVAASESGGGLLTEMALHVFDVSSPVEPMEIDGSPLTAPVTTSMVADPVSGTLFLYGLTGHDLTLYDIHEAVPVAAAGQPLALRALYPQENNTSFQLRNLQIDAARGRLLGARAQGAMSEVIAFDLPSPPPLDANNCPVPLAYGALQMVEDHFDVNVEPADRPNLLDGFMAVPDPATGGAFLVASAHDGVMSQSLVIPMTSELGIMAGAGCGDFEGFGCWYKTYYGGNPGYNQLTDGAACYDAAHQVFVGTSYDPNDDESNGSLHLYKVNGDSMSPFLDADGDTITSGLLPVAAVCH
jgi:hypothetical protein